MRNTLLTVGLLTAALLAFETTSEAEAQGRDVNKTMDLPDRSGFVLGGSFGRGSIDVRCTSCDNRPKLTEALSVAAHVGYYLTPRLAVLAEHWSVRYNARGGAWFDDSARHLVAQHISTVAAQMFVTDTIWLKAGVGMGWHITDGDYAKTPAMRVGPQPIAKGGERPEMEEASGRSPASFAAVGWEFAHNSVFSADVQLRVGASRRADERYEVYNTGVNVGFNWY